MDEKEKKISPKTDEIDTVSGDIEKIEEKSAKKAEKSAPAAKKKVQKKDESADKDEKDNKDNKEDKEGKGKKKSTHTPMSARTKKRLIRVGIVTGAILLVLATVLTVVTVLNNRPPKLEDVRDRFELLLTKSQEINEILWGAGLPTYARIDRTTKTFEVDVVKENGDPVLDKDGQAVKKALRYYQFEDATYGTIIAYEYQVRVSEGKTTEVEVNGEIQTVNVYTVYDVENGRVLTEYENGASRFARKTEAPIEGETPLLEKDGFYYYALPSYQNEDLVHAQVYEAESEDEHYDFVRPNDTYTHTEDVKNAVAAVYSNAFAGPLYEYLFTGVIGAINEANQPAYMDYSDDEGNSYLMRSNNTGSWKWRDPLPVVVFDFSTMQMVKGNARKVTITLDYRLEGSDEVKQMAVDFVLESGEWYLNTPSFG